MQSISLLLLTLAVLAVSYIKDAKRTRKVLLISSRSFMSLVPNLLGMILAITPPEALTRLFSIHGIIGFILTATAGVVITIPAPIAYPLAGTLLKLGVSLPTLATFITTLTMVGTVTAPMEIEYFGKRFTLVRQGLSLALAILIGLLMGAIL